MELLVVIGIIAILAALLLPALSQTKGSAKAAACRNNLREAGIGVNLYLSDFEKYPLDYDDETGRRIYWRDLLFSYCGSDSQVLVCPAVFPQVRRSFPDWDSAHSLGAADFGYAYNDWGTDRFNTAPTQGTNALGLGGLDPVPEGRVRLPSDMLAIGEGGLGVYIPGFGWPGYGGAAHNRNANAVFCDAHVESHNFYTDPKGKSGIYEPDVVRAKRWNKDNEPHPETWR